MKDYKQARQELAKRIQDKGWTLDSHNILQRSGRTASDWDKQSGHYAFTLRSPKQGLEYQGEYSVGSGILAAWASENGSASGLVSMGTAWERKLFRAPLWNAGRLSIAQAEQLPAIRRAYRPDIVDVVSSMLSDASGWDPECTLREWVDSTGYEWKHPADALDTFEAIRGEVRFLRRALSGSDLEEWCEIAGRL